jgi:hypothetical protein
MIALDGLLDRLPIFTKGAEKVQAHDVHLFMKASLSGKDLTWQEN